MLIKISADLKKEEIYANGAELANIMGMDRKNGKRVISYPLEKSVFVHSFKNPVLLTDNYKISKLNPTKRDTLFSLFSGRPRIVEYDGVSVIDKSYHPSVWCPSIDTVLFARGLKKLFAKRKKFNKVIEIGTGSGFLSKFILEKNKEVKTIVVNDLNNFAVDCAKDNIKDKRAILHTGDGIKKLNVDKYDLIICNPPYIPRPKSIDETPYEGVSLLYDLIHNYKKYLNKNGILITNISSLCESIVIDKSLKFNVIDKMEVPLKVNNVLNNKNWIKYLESKGLKKQFKEGYEYWQTLKIVVLENN